MRLCSAGPAPSSRGPFLVTAHTSSSTEYTSLLRGQLVAINGPTYGGQACLSPLRTVRSLLLLASSLISISESIPPHPEVQVPDPPHIYPPTWSLSGKTHLESSRRCFLYMAYTGPKVLAIFSSLVFVHFTHAVSLKPVLVHSSSPLDACLSSSFRPPHPEINHSHRLVNTFHNVCLDLPAELLSF